MPIHKKLFEHCVVALDHSAITAGGVAINALCFFFRLKEGGTQLLEVIDNGHGVREIDFQGLSKKSGSISTTKYNNNNFEIFSKRKSQSSMSEI